MAQAKGVVSLATKFSIENGVVRLNSMAMPMAEKVVLTAKTAILECMTESEIATFVKKVLTAEWPDCTWQVLVGRNFGSCVQFEESRYIYFYVGQVGFVVFSSD